MRGARYGSVWAYSSMPIVDGTEQGAAHSPPEMSRLYTVVDRRDGGTL